MQHTESPKKEWFFCSAAFQPCDQVLDVYYYQSRRVTNIVQPNMQQLTGFLHELPQLGYQIFR
jgi:hypothetical protein